MWSRSWNLEEEVANVRAGGEAGGRGEKTRVLLCDMKAAVCGGHVVV